MARFAKWELTQQSTLCSGAIIRPGAAGACNVKNAGIPSRLTLMLHETPVSRHRFSMYVDAPDPTLKPKSS
jgi:hypothetical protein